MFNFLSQAISHSHIVFRIRRPPLCYRQTNKNLGQTTHRCASVKYILASLEIVHCVSVEYSHQYQEINISF